MIKIHRTGELCFKFSWRAKWPGLTVNGSSGRTALAYAAQCEDNYIFGMVYDAYRPDNAATSVLDAEDKSGRTPLSFAAEAGNADTVRLLMKSGRVNPNSKDGSGRTPLWYTAVRKHPLVVKLLIDSGQVAVDHRDVDGKSPLLLALTGSAYLIAAWAEVVANILIDTGEVDLDIKDSFGRTPLFHAALGNCRSIVQRLLASGRVDAGRRDTDGRTPLFFAINNFEIGTARQTLPSAIQQLLAHDHVDVNATDRYGCTPLIRAVARSAPHALELLLKRPDLHFGRGDEDGSTAFAIALREGNHDVIRLLREKYAEVGKQVPDMAEVRQQDDMEEGQETGP